MYAYQNNYPPTHVGQGTATRIYKNAAGDTVRIDDITVAFYSRQRPQLSQEHDNEFHISAKRQFKASRFYPGPGSSRIVAEITLIGDFDSAIEAAGDFTSATWVIGASDCEVGMTDLPGVGDSVN